MRKAIAVGVLLVGLAVPVSGQQLGIALWNQGYTRTLYLEASTHALTLGPFNPNAAGQAERYGPAIDWHFSFGNTVGERASCETVDRFVAAGYLPGLGAGYRCTQFDLGDAKLITRNGQRAAYDDMLATLMTTPSPPAEPPAAPPVCPAGKSCLAPGEGCPPVSACPDCPAPPESATLCGLISDRSGGDVRPLKFTAPPGLVLTFERPSAVRLTLCASTTPLEAVAALVKDLSLPPAPPAPPPPAACPDLAGVPSDIVPLLKEILGYSVMGPGRHAKVQRVLAWVSGVAAVKEVKP